MASRVRILKIAVGALCGALAGLLAGLIFSALPASVTKGAPPTVHLAVVVDTGVGEPIEGTGLGSALLGPLATELRPAPRAAKAMLDSLKPVDQRVYTFDATAARSAGLLLLQSPPVKRSDGALGQALTLARLDFAKSFGPKLVCIWLDRPTLGPSDLAAAKALKDLGWEIRVYGTSNCDPEVMRNLASDIHFAYREPKPGVSKTLRVAISEIPQREAGLMASFTERPSISPAGRSVIAGLVTLLLVLLLSTAQTMLLRRSAVVIVSALVLGAALGGAAAGMAQFPGQAVTWTWIAAAGAGLALAVPATNARWLALFFIPGLVGAAIGLIPLPLDLVWGPAVLGFLFGVVAAATEELSRWRYLEIRDSARVRLVNLGAREVSFGSSRKCSYVLPDGNGRIAAIRVGADGPYRVDTLTGRTRNLHPGEPQRISRLSVVAHGRWGSPPVVADEAGGQLVLKVGDQVFELMRGTAFSALQLPVSKGSPDGTVAEVMETAATLGAMGLMNRSGAEWSAILPSGARASIPPGQAVRLAAGTRISFGAGDGVVEGR